MEPLPDPALVDRIDAWLPQTQCRRCGYAGCRPYAEALARSEADTNRCPPGGEVTISNLAALLGAAPKLLDPAVGPTRPRTRARIVEADCIGCTLCIHACPVDAIVGARKQMHTVLADACTGCELCVPPCPVGCIEMVPAAVPPNSLWPGYSREEADRARRRWRAREERLARRAARPSASPPQPAAEREQIKAEIQAAVARVRARRQARRPDS